MPATGLHGIVGYFSCLLGMRSEKFKKYFTEKFNYGFVVGNFLPDYDGPLSIFIWLASGDLSLTSLAIIEEEFHRTLTHSVITISLVIAFGFLISYKSRDLRDLFVGIGLGMLLHSLLDLPWMVGVAFFWPIIPDKIGVFWSIPEPFESVRKSLFRFWYAMFGYLIYKLPKKEGESRRGLLYSIYAFLLMTLISLACIPFEFFIIVHGLTELAALFLIALVLYKYRNLVSLSPLMKSD
ncbi:MAG: metal-dependent hydrolase [Candidatus Asgardarchaeia archaeon]